jgi:hypothetical protein
MYERNKIQIQNIKMVIKAQFAKTLNTAEAGFERFKKDGLKNWLTFGGTV